MQEKNCETTGERSSGPTKPPGNHFVRELGRGALPVFHLAYRSKRGCGQDTGRFDRALHIHVLYMQRALMGLKRNRPLFLVEDTSQQLLLLTRIFAVHCVKLQSHGVPVFLWQQLSQTPCFSKHAAP